MTVNHGVPGSSPGGGATLDKPSEMMAFSLSFSELGWLHHSVFLFILKTIYETLIYCANSFPND